MPPPLLSRHLRPCHHPWSARHVRHPTRRATIRSASSDDKSKSAGSESSLDRGRDAAQKRRDSWWSSAMASISSLDLRTHRAEPNTPPTPSTPPPTTAPPLTAAAPHVTPPTARRGSEPPSRGKQVHTKEKEKKKPNGAMARDPAVGSPSTSFRITDKGKTMPQHRLRPTHQDGAIAEDPAAGRLSIRTYVAKKDKPMPQYRSRPLGQDRLAEDPEVSRPTGRHQETRIGNSVHPIVQHRPRPTFSARDSTVQESDQNSVQWQLQQLFEQVQVLQKALAEKTSATTRTASSAPRTTDTATPASRMLRAKASTHTAPSARHVVLEDSKSHRVLRQAYFCYNRSVNVLVNVVNELETSMSTAAIPIAHRMRQHLTVLMGVARADRDTRLLRALGRYKGARLENVVFEEPYLQRFAEGTYRQSVHTLVQVARALQRMTSPAVVPLALRTQHRLGAIADQASEENDWRLRNALLEYGNVTPVSGNSSQENKTKPAERLTPQAAHSLPPNFISARASESPTSATKPVKSITTRPDIQHTPRRTSAATLHNRAWACYRNSVAALIEISDEIHHDMPDTGASILASIQEGVLAIMIDAKVKETRRTLRLFGKYDASFVVRQAQLKTLGFMGLRKQSRLFALFLADIARELESMSSPFISRLAIKVRRQLQSLEGEAEAANDKSMLLTLEKIKACDRALALNQHGRVDASPPSSGPARALVSVSRSSEQPTRIRKYEVDAEVQPAVSRGFAFRRVELDHHETKTKDGVASPPELGRSTGAQLQIPNHTRRTPLIHEGQDDQALERQVHTQARIVKSSQTKSESSLITAAAEQVQSKPLAAAPQTPPTRSVQDQVEPPLNAEQQPLVQSQSDNISEQSLLDELFPEVTTPAPPPAEQDTFKHSKLELPKSGKALVRRVQDDRPKNLKDQVIQSFQQSGEKITVLQLEHCSTELTESDFRRLIPKGKHIEEWARHGEFYKVIPGRDPLSLERLPFYYLLFRSPESATAYQKNVARLHKLTALHQPSSIFSAVPVPTGFIEDGEDINDITKSYLLKPTEHPLTLHTLMQPYHPALRNLIERGGYNPIMPDVDNKGNRIYKVLLHVEGYEPSHSDLHRILRRDAYLRGTSLNLRNELSTSIHRLRDIINLKTRSLPISTTNPRAYGHFEESDQTLTERAKTKLEFEDPSISAWMKGDDASDENAQEVNQMVMNRVYNRWLIEFEDEDEAKRFVVQWHRRVLPELLRGDRTWKDYEEVRMCNCEFLW